jgi:hypothetical protein
MRASDHFTARNRSDYVRGLTMRQQRQQRRNVRNALIAGLLLCLGLGSSFLGYTFLAMPEAIAANTGDSVKLIQTIGLFGSILALLCYIGVPLLYIFDLAD